MNQSNAENLSELIAGRVAALASAARDTSASIENDQDSFRDGSEPIDNLVVDAVVKRVDSMAADCDELIRILAGYNSLVDEHRATSRAGKPLHGAESLPDADQPYQSPGVSEGVRLLATQMSVAGSGPAEIAQRLRDEFGVENSAALVRELFGQS